MSLLLGVSCQRAAPPSAEQLAGCWAFERRDGGAAAPLGAEMPDTIRLDSALQLNPDGRPHPYYPLRLAILSRRFGAGRDTLRLDSAHVVPFPPDWDGYYALTGWRFAAPDSLTLVFHANMSTSWHYRLRALGASADSLAGRAVMYSDVTSDTLNQVPLVGRRTACRARSKAAA